jgi:hypothetical protein
VLRKLAIRLCVSQIYVTPIEPGNLRPFSGTTWVRVAIHFTSGLKRSRRPHFFNPRARVQRGPVEQPHSAAQCFPHRDQPLPVRPESYRGDLFRMLCLRNHDLWPTDSIMSNARSTFSAPSVLRVSQASSTACWSVTEVMGQTCAFAGLLVAAAISVA